MGAVESCCGKRRPADMPSMPTKPVSALGNQYVTFNPEQPEVFIMRQRIWTSHQPFDVKDIALNDWFKIEGKDAQVMARHPHWPLSRVSPFSNGPCCHRARRERRSALAGVGHVLSDQVPSATGAGSATSVGRDDSLLTVRGSGAVDRPEEAGSEHGGAALLRGEKEPGCLAYLRRP
jgi:hypothetical protein